MIDKERLQTQGHEENEPLYGVSQDTIRAIEEALEKEEKEQVRY